MRSKRRVGMWTLGLTLVVMGAALLYRELTGVQVEIGKYWPLAIVGLGVELLVTQTLAGRQAEGAQGVRVSGLAVIGLIIILAAAPLAGGPWTTSCSPVGVSCGGGSANQQFRIENRLLGVDWTGVVELSAAVTFGKIEIRPVVGSDAPTAYLEVVGHGFTAGSAKRVAEAADLKVERTDGRLVLRGENQTAGNGSEHADLNLTLRVPAQVGVSVNNEFGPVDIEGIDAPVRAFVRYASATVGDITGDVSVEAEHGHADVSRVTGAVTVRATYGGVDVADVSGRVDVVSKHGGVEIRDLQSTLVCKATYGRVAVTEVAGDVDIESTHGSVDLRYPGGAVSVKATYAGITVRYDTAVTAACILEDKYGGISVECPKESKLDLDVVSERTRITTNIPGLAVTAVGSGSTLKGQYNGGGTLVDVRNDFGRVEVRVF